MTGIPRRGTVIPTSRPKPYTPEPNPDAETPTKEPEAGRRIPKKGQPKLQD